MLGQKVRRGQWLCGGIATVPQSRGAGRAGGVDKCRPALQFWRRNRPEGPRPMTASILVLNGPNLNLLGTRQPEVYGATTLADIEAMCRAAGERLGLEIGFAQSNHEGALVDMIHAARGRHAGIVLNAGAYTHTSIAIMDAISSVELPVAEVHLSNIHRREEFRHLSYVSKVAVGMICGFGAIGYVLAIEALADRLG